MQSVDHPRRLRKIIALSILTFWAVAIASSVRGDMSHDLPTADTPNEGQVHRRWCPAVHYGDKGLEYVPEHSDTSLWIGLRFQTRLDTYGGNLATIEDLLENRQARLSLRRGRVKGGGTLWWDWLEVYSEYDFPSDTLLDYRTTTTWRDWLSIRAGQWKSEYNRERVDSSGKQQLAERSISTYWFTIDRQAGLAASVRNFKGKTIDHRIWLEYLSGQGRGGSFQDNSGLWLSRLQWNPAGEQLPFSQSDLKRRESPLPSLAVATVNGRTPFTRFSSSGGGSLPGFDEGDFDLDQFLFETAVHYRGWAWQQELHWKSITNRQTGMETRLIGGYAQIGTFPADWCGGFPDPLEFVARVAIVDPNRGLPENDEREWTVGSNWFFNGHRNKLTQDFSFIEFDSPDRDESQLRYRVQWELSI